MRLEPDGPGVDAAVPAAAAASLPAAPVLEGARSKGASGRTPLAVRLGSLVLVVAEAGPGEGRSPPSPFLSDLMRCLALALRERGSLSGSDLYLDRGMPRSTGGKARRQGAGRERRRRMLRTNTKACDYRKTGSPPGQHRKLGG